REVDPAAVRRPAWHALPRRGGGDPPDEPRAELDRVDVAVALPRRVEDDLVAVGGPAGSATGYVERGQLRAPGAVRLTDPDLRGGAGPRRGERQHPAVGRELGGFFELGGRDQLCRISRVHRCAGCRELQYVLRVTADQFSMVVH